MKCNVLGTFVTHDAYQAEVTFTGTQLNKYQSLWTTTACHATENRSTNKILSVAVGSTVNQSCLPPRFGMG